jgi:two-component system, sensor histidine kinase PdtaS
MRKIFLCLLVAAFQPIFAQNPALDSLLRRLSAENEGTKRLPILEQMVAEAFKADISQALRYAKQGMAEADRLGDPHWQPKFYEMRGRMHANSQQLDSASLFFEKAMSGYRAVDDKKGQASTAFKMAWVARNRSELEKAMEYDLAALRMMEALGDQAGMAKAYNNLSADLYYQSKPAEALEYAQKAVETAEKGKAPIELNYGYIAVADAHILLKQPAQALEYYDKALALTRQMELGDIEIGLTLNLRANALKHLQRYPEALATYRESLAIGEKTGYEGIVFATLANISDVLMRQGKYAEALPYQLRSCQMQEAEQGSQLNLTENYQHLSVIYEQLGDYKSALDYHKKFQAMRDSSLDIASDAAMLELKTRYETEKKEATIAAQASQLSEQRKVQWLSIGVAGLLALLAFSFWRGYAQRTRANRRLAAKNAENELLLKEIHHRVKNNLQTISSLLNLQSASIADPNALEAVRESQSRVRSMALIHQKLYQGENLAAVKMKDYFEAMGQAVLHAFGEAGKRVALRVPMSELELDVDTAIPLGLIANELLTNALKYAFPPGNSGQIEISLVLEADRQFCLRVADDGVGAPSEAAPQGTGFGSRLVQLLAIQLNGRVEQEARHGMATTIRFSPLAKAA